MRVTARCAIFCRRSRPVRTGFGVARIEATTVQSVTVLNHMSLIGLLSVKAFVTGQQTRIG